MSTTDIIALIILGIPFVAGVIGVIITKKRTGRRWKGQGFGE